MSLLKKEIFIYGKHKSFSDFIKISDNNDCMSQIEKIFDNAIFFSSESTAKVNFYIFHKKAGFITGAVLQSMDSKFRKSPFLLCIRDKNSNVLKNWNYCFSTGFRIFDQTLKIVDKNFEDINSFKKAAFQTKEFKFLQHDINGSDNRIKNFVIEKIKTEKENLKNSKIMIFKVEKQKKNDILEILYHTKKFTNFLPFSFFLRENSHNFQLSFFYRKFSQKDLTEIWTS